MKIADKLGQVRSYCHLLTSYLSNWRNLILTAYLFFVLMSYFIVNMDLRNFGRAYIISLAEVILIISIFLSTKLLHFAEDISIHHGSEEKITIKFFIETWLVSLAVFFAMYIIYYPGGFSPDSIDQYGQAAGIKNYNDWHPVLHTLFAFTLPLKLSGGWVGSIVLFQIIVFSLALAYMAFTLAEFGNIKYARLFLLYILINPATLGISMYPWKDVTFAVFAMLSMCFAVRVYFSDGEWLKSLGHMIIFLLVMAAATIFRHNAILFTFPLLIAVMFYVSSKRKVLLAAGFVLIIFLIKIPLYSSLKAEKPGNRITETTGVPITIMGHAVKETPDNIDTDIQEFIYAIAPRGAWEKKYRTGDFNSIKFSGVNTNIIEEAGYTKILDMMFRCFKKSHLASLKGFLALTDMVYSIAGPVRWWIIPGIVHNKYGIEGRGVNLLQKIFVLYLRFTRWLCKHVFWHIGVLMLIMFILILAKVYDIKKLFLVLALFSHNFGTMLLLSGDDFRFFYCTYLIMPLVCLVLLVKKGA